MKALITGISGFVGQYLEQLLTLHSIPVIGTTRIKRKEKNWLPLDLLSEEQIVLLLKMVNPSHIFHLAGISNVKYSWSGRKDVMEANTIATINLLEAVKKVNKRIRVITIGSSEEYGRVVKSKVSENEPLNPISPYGISKAAVSMLSQLYYMADNLNVIHVRPFNHIGPGQRLGFVTSDFANQIALINTAVLQSQKINIGNLDAIRDFTDVRDIAAAYYDIAVCGNAGEIYNVCSGKGTKIEEVLEIFLSFSKIPIEINKDKSKLRPSEIPVMIGNNEKLISKSNWKPKIALEKSLHDIYQYWLSKYLL
ncbi:GDP-mannose 4,6-dehydratase [Cytobacillus firmus]|uniref:GDP-mannose 4,6-dehydratase n=1 Tax=Cytobacillus firmus TaxID=1399 RepID=UPI0021627817|nr:GDP-mannose 4,6-dehydratase [Cytobacillus firmus]MCS0674070.1 GDP-mannose 4,6-dehydratase [Cytobacillus firmus]